MVELSIYLAEAGRSVRATSNSYFAFEGLEPNIRNSPNERRQLTEEAKPIERSITKMIKTESCKETSIIATWFDFKRPSLASSRKSDRNTECAEARENYINGGKWLSSGIVIRRAFASAMLRPVTADHINRLDRLPAGQVDDNMNPVHSEGRRKLCWEKLSLECLNKRASGRADRCRPGQS